MFDIGFTELMLIGIVSLIVIGPERLPAVARTAGQWVAKVQRFVRGVKTDLASELESGDLKKLIGDQREQINELREMVSSARQDFETSTRDVVQGAKKRLDEMETSARDTDSTAGSAEKLAPDASTGGNEAPGDAQPAAQVDNAASADNIRSASEVSAQPDGTTSNKPLSSDNATDRDRAG